MSGALLSAAWYRVVALKPRLRSHARLYRHHYRGEVWFVMRDPASGRTHRFTPGARLILNGLDGTRSIGELWEIGNRRLGDDAPTQDELIGLLGQLHAADLMQCDVTPDVAELFQRAQRHDRAKTRQAFGNPMSIKLALFDPDRFLERLAPIVRPLWNRWGLIAWLAVVLPAVVLALSHRAELVDNIADRVFAAHNLVMLWLLFPLIKVLHELGHGLATKVRGGEVHEVGVMLLVFVPVPYVDASAATTFRSKYERAVVGLAGMAVEVFLAALAMYLWLNAEPGLLRSVAFNVMLVAGISTVIFNGNPLLRYDAYYVLADLIEIPNLASRSNRYIGYLFERHLFGARDLEAPQASAAEKRWFVCYAIASFLYRTFVSIAIILFIAGEFFVIGVLLAAWAFAMMAVVPIGKLIGHLANTPRLARVRGRVFAVSGGLAALVLVAILVVPVPFRTQAEGIVWLPEQAIVRAGGDGFHSRFVAAPGSLVKKGDALIVCVDPVLDALVRVGEAKVGELQAQFDAQFVEDRAEAEITRQQLEREQGALARLRERAANLIVTSPSDGRFLVPQAVDMPGRFFRKGELFGYVTEGARTLVRVVIQQGDVDLVHLATREVELRNAYRLSETLVGRVIREVPGGSAQLPSRALATEGGGLVAVDPRDGKGTKALQRTFQLDIDLPPDGFALYGGRVHVRFEYFPEPLGSQWYRSLRQMFLSRFHV